MKKMFFFFGILFSMFFSLSAQAQKKADDVMKLTKTAYEMGNIPMGKPYSFDIEFTNTSKKPLVIESAMGSCGCTVPTPTKKPIAPGKNGKVSVTYNPTGVGTFHKDVTIKFAGVAEPKVVYFSGTVVQK